MLVSMIFGHIGEREQWAFMASHPVWRQAFNWLLSLQLETEPGRYPIIGEDVYGIVMRYATAPQELCRFESHRCFVDLQYTLSGGEKIGWARAATLRPDGAYDPATDLQFHLPAQPAAIVHKTAGHFSIYYPSDAHMPKLNDGTHPEVFKAVVKIARHRLE